MHIRFQNVVVLPTRVSEQLETWNSNQKRATTRHFILELLLKCCHLNKHSILQTSTSARIQEIHMEVVEKTQV